MNFREKPWIVLIFSIPFIFSCIIETTSPIDVKTGTEGKTTMIATIMGRQITQVITSTQAFLETSTPFTKFTPIPSVLPPASPSPTPLSTFEYYTATLSITMPPATQVANETKGYYFDSLDGDDNASGTSSTTAWKSLEKMNSFEFQTGDIIHLKRGSRWTGGLIISKSGVIFRAYGEGEKPIFENPGNNTNAVRINVSNVVMEDILARNAFYSGFYISQNANDNVIRNVEATNVGIGIAVNGRNNLVTQNYIHDLKMIVNTVGGTDDYGAVGVEIFNGPNEVSYNRLVNCIAPSYDFGTDGGAVEIYLNYGNADGSSFHHNYAENTDGFIEIHSRDKSYSANNVAIFHNVIVNTRQLADIGMPGYGGGHELTSVNNIRFEHNTFVDTISRTQDEWRSVLSFHGVTPKPEQVFFRNNIIYAVSYWWVANTGIETGGFIHTNNIYYFNLQRSSLGFQLDSTEKRIDPQFVDVIQGNFHLKSTSPAIDAGANLGYILDFENYAIPNEEAPDIGAFER